MKYILTKIFFLITSLLFISCSPVAQKLSINTEHQEDSQAIDIEDEPANSEPVENLDETNNSNFGGLSPTITPTPSDNTSSTNLNPGRGSSRFSQVFSIIPSNFYTHAAKKNETKTQTHYTEYYKRIVRINSSNFYIPGGYYSSGQALKIKIIIPPGINLFRVTTSEMVTTSPGHRISAVSLSNYTSPSDYPLKFYNGNPWAALVSTGEANALIRSETTKEHSAYLLYQGDEKGNWYANLTFVMLVSNPEIYNKWLDSNSFSPGIYN